SMTTVLWRYRVPVEVGVDDAGFEVGGGDDAGLKVGGGDGGDFGLGVGDVCPRCDPWPLANGCAPAVAGGTGTAALVVIRVSSWHPGSSPDGAAVIACRISVWRSSVGMVSAILNPAGEPAGSGTISLNTRSGRSVGVALVPGMR